MSQSIAERLIAAALDRNASDNVTALLVSHTTGQILAADTHPAPWTA